MMAKIIEWCASKSKPQMRSTRLLSNLPGYCFSYHAEEVPPLSCVLAIDPLEWEMSASEDASVCQTCALGHSPLGNLAILSLVHHQWIKSDTLLALGILAHFAFTDSSAANSLVEAAAVER